MSISIHRFASRASTPIQDHARVNDILLGPLERPALRWLSARMPRWVTPDLLTVLGLLSAFLIMASYWLTTYAAEFLWLANFGFILHWFADSLDGTLARFRHIERPKYGFFVDHTVDAASETLIGVGIALSPYVQFELAILALVSYLLMSVFVLVKTAVTGVFRISFSRIGPTEVRLFIILANTLIYFIGNPTIDHPLGTSTIYDVMAVFFSAALFGLFIVCTTREALLLRRSEPPGES